MKIRSIQGWMGRSGIKQLKKRGFDREIGISDIPPVYPRKKNELWWGEEDWPPIKVTIDVSYGWEDGK